MVIGQGPPIVLYLGPQLEPESPLLSKVGPDFTFSPQLLSETV